MSHSPDLAIRLSRARFNQAIADADLDTIATLLAPDVVLVAGTDSAVIAGRKAQLATWKREFAAAGRAIYVRTPGSVTVSPAFPLAFEHGEWRGMAAADGTLVAIGTYTSKWRQFGSEWLIEAELFLTLA